MCSSDLDYILEGKEKIKIREGTLFHLWDPRKTYDQIEKLEDKIRDENSGCCFLSCSPTVCTNEYLVIIYEGFYQITNIDNIPLAYGNSVDLQEAKLNAIYDYISHKIVKTG